MCSRGEGGRHTHLPSLRLELPQFSHGFSSSDKTLHRDEALSKLLVVRLRLVPTPRRLHTHSAVVLQLCAEVEPPEVTPHVPLELQHSLPLAVERALCGETPKCCLKTQRGTLAPKTLGESACCTCACVFLHRDGSGANSEEPSSRDDAPSVLLQYDCSSVAFVRAQFLEVCHLRHRESVYE